MQHHMIFVLVVTLVFICSMRVCCGDKVEVPFKNIPKVELKFDLGDQEQNWKIESDSDDSVSYSSNGYSLNLNLEKKGIQQILRLKLTPPAGQKLSVQSYAAKVIAPTTGLHSVMVPNSRMIAHTLIYYHEHRTWPENPKVYRCLVPEGFEEMARSNHEAPFILLTDDKGNNALSVGWARTDWFTKLNGAAEGDNYVLSLLRKDDQPFKGDSIEDALIISTAPEPWMDVDKRYAMAFDEFNKFPKRAPAPAWTDEPVYCTWYCYDDHIDQAAVIRIAQKCKELGFKTILIDAGWDAAENGGFGDFENGILGDFIAVPDRFPDFTAMVKEIHDMGIRVELWSGPFWEGRKSHSYQEKTKDCHIWTDEGEAHELCPKHPFVREHLREKFAEVAKRYNIDGMWLDAADSVPAECKAKHEHIDQTMGEAFVDCMVAIREGLRSVNPEAITEARVLHANLNSKRGLDIIQPSDAPKSFEYLRLAGIHIRPWAYDIVLKNDPMNWRRETDGTTVAKFLATMVCNGVPALSIDYLTAPEEQCQLTKAWLAFFQEHKKTLLKGEFSLFGENYGTPDNMLIGDDEAVVYFRNPKTTKVDLPKSVKRVYLLNCTTEDKLTLSISNLKGTFEVQNYSPDWSKTGSPASLTAEGTLSLSQTIPQGGSAVITLK